VIAALLLAGFGCLGAGAVVDLVRPGAVAPLRQVPSLLCLAGTALVSAGAVEVLLLGSRVYRLGALFGIGVTTVRADRLAGGFLALTMLLGVAVAAGTTSWVRRNGDEVRRGMGAGLALLLASVAGVVLAGDTFSFVFSWELLTVSFFVLAGLRPRRGGDGTAAWLTLGIGRVSGVCLLFGFLLLAGARHSFELSAWAATPPGALRDAAYGLVVAGFAGKLGIIPLQGWIPVGYPSAPAPVRAALAGIGANVAVYGLFRFLGLLGRPPVWLVVVVLLLGGLTALVGIAFAGVETRLARVIAFSSVENAGIIFTAFGVALAGASSGSRLLEAAGLLAASLHTVAHAIAKSTLFVTGATLEDAAGTDDLEGLRGVGRRQPGQAAAFAAAALTLAGLPPSVGFVSEWFVLEALMQEYRLGGLALRLAMAGAGALVALTAGLAALAFVRILGLVVLGRPPGGVAARRRPGWLAGGAAAALGLACYGVAAVSPLEVRVVARVLAPVIAPRAVEQSLRSPWVLQPTYAGFSILSPSWLLVAMPVGIAVVALVALALSKGRYLRVRRVPAWRSATGGVRGPASYSAFGFANPLRHVLSNVLGTRRETTLVETEADTVRGRGRVRYLTTVLEPVEAYLYGPLAKGLLWCARQARRLQSGRLEAYVAYMLVTLLTVLAVVAWMR
jgi:formate hydrogenlyase subunit 3/multisubunit Na+/H+ antiporter MnhD subunit